MTLEMDPLTSGLQCLEAWEKLPRSVHFFLLFCILGSDSQRRAKYKYRSSRFFPVILKLAHPWKPRQLTEPQWLPLMCCLLEFVFFLFVAGRVFVTWLAIGGWTVELVLTTVRKLVLVQWLRSKETYSGDFEERWLNIGEKSCWKAIFLKSQCCTNDLEFRMKNVLFQPTSHAQWNLKQTEHVQRKISLKRWLSCHFRVKVFKNSPKWQLWT